VAEEYFKVNHWTEDRPHNHQKTRGWEQWTRLNKRKAARPLSHWTFCLHGVIVHLESPIRRLETTNRYMTLKTRHLLSKILCSIGRHHPTGAPDSVADHILANPTNFFLPTSQFGKILHETAPHNHAGQICFYHKEEVATRQRSCDPPTAELETSSR
jgi:hypothetical protein